MGILSVVHCIDTEGPLDESKTATFERLNNIFKIKLEPSLENYNLLLEGKISNSKFSNSDIQKVFNKQTMNYNRNWEEIEKMVKEAISSKFRDQFHDSRGLPWKYSWHVMDHIGFDNDNPRNKPIGIGEVFKRYKSWIKQQNYDYLGWHFHPIALSQKNYHAATSLLNSTSPLIQSICYRVLEHDWFPAVNRPGFHSIRTDWNLFYEQWMPFEYSNQFTHEDSFQSDMEGGRFGDWRRSPNIWSGYNPDIHDYQIPGQCNRKIFRILNLGTRGRLLKEIHLKEAFTEASKQGHAVIAFADHDWRDIKEDVIRFNDMLNKLKKVFPNVEVYFESSLEAARRNSKIESYDPISLVGSIYDNKYIVEIKNGQIYSSTPFLSILDCEGNYQTDNFDEIEKGKKWSFFLGDDTLKIDFIKKIGCGAAGKDGSYSTNKIII